MLGQDDAQDASPTKRADFVRYLYSVPCRVRTLAALVGGGYTFHHNGEEFARLQTHILSLARSAAYHMDDYNKCMSFSQLPRYVYVME